MLLQASLLLARVRTFEQLRRQSPGELGSLLGLDRCAEVKTLRRLTRQLAGHSEAVRARLTTVQPAPHGATTNCVTLEANDVRISELG